MAQPNVSFTIGDGNLGQIGQSLDGVALLIVNGVSVAGKFALGDVIGPLYTPSDAASKGIDAAYDTTNSTEAFETIKNFYAEAGEGSELYVMVVSNTVTLAQMLDKTGNFAPKALQQLQGRIRLIGVKRNPAGGYTPTITNGLDADVHAAVTKSQELADAQLLVYAPIHTFIDGRSFSGTPGDLLDYRATGTSRSASIVLGTSKSSAGSSVGLVLGRAAKISVNRNIGRVKDGPVNSTYAGLTNAGAITTFTKTQLDVIHDKGYIFFNSMIGKTGFYINDDNNCMASTSDFNSVSASRAIDKAIRVSYNILSNELKDDVEVDPATGQLPVAVTKYYESVINAGLDQMVAAQELSAGKSTVPVAQNLNQSKQLTATIRLVKRGTVKTIVVPINFALTL